MHQGQMFSNNVVGLYHLLEKLVKMKELVDNKTTSYNKKITSITILIDLDLGNNKYEVAANFI